jgi:hyperosmotically inducible protein
MVMKRIPVFLAFLLFATSVLWAQEKTAKPAKAKPDAVDCSTVDDSALTADVKAKLAAAPSLKDVTINVATSSGVVTLTGTANKPTQKGTASLVAKAVKCVKKVDNRMTIEGSGTKKTKSKSTNQ